MRYRRPLLLDVRLFVLTVFSVLALGRVFSLVIPSEFYFTFQSLFADRTPQNQILALFGKMLAPFACGFTFGWFIYARPLSAALPGKKFSTFARRLRFRWSPTMFLAGFFAAFLSAWPIIVYWDLLANPEVAHLKAIFFALYVLYMFGFGYVTLFGFLGALFVNEYLEGGKYETAKLVSVAELSRVGMLWILSSGIASATMKMITK
jgi:hypothetical protein